MLQATVTPSRGMRDSAFGALNAAVLGFGFLEAGCILLKSGPGAHLLNLLVGGSLILLTLRRFLMCWPAKEALSGSEDRRPRIFGMLRLLASIFVAGAGYFAADVLSGGVVSAFTLFAIGGVLMPWTRIARNRADCLGYGIAGALGIIAALLTGNFRSHPIFLLVVTWLLWMSALTAWLRLVLDEKRMRRLAAGRPGDNMYRQGGDAAGPQTAGASYDKMSRLAGGKVQH